MADAKFFAIPDVNLARLEAEIIRLNNQPSRIAKPIVLAWQEPQEQIYKDPMLEFSYVGNVSHCQGPDEIAELLTAAEASDWGCCGGVFRVSINRFVSIAASIIRSKGYVARSRASNMERCTADLVWDICVCPTGNAAQTLLRNNHQVEAADTSLGLAAVNWAANLYPEQSNLFNDLADTCRCPCVSSGSAALVASVFRHYETHLANRKRLEVVGAVWNRNKRPNRTKKQAKSTGCSWVGRKDQEMNLKRLLMGRCKSFGCTEKPETYVEFFDLNGNKLIWRADAPPAWLETAVEVNLKVKVLDHVVYGGYPETLIGEVELLKMFQLRGTATDTAHVGVEDDDSD